MAGIYIHVPFCHKKCFYCDFYKTTTLESKPQFLNALFKELSIRKSFLGNETIKTIYFGGGTPSVLTSLELTTIITRIYELFDIEKTVEITIEANPDDLSKEYLKMLADTPVNRLSIGIQSFFDDDLQQMGRRHNSRQAIHCVSDAYNSGFENLSIDLIYGLPNLTTEKWAQNLKQVFQLPVKHLSAYHLTYHEGTHFFELKKRGFLSEIPEKESIIQFQMLLNETKKHGFEQYEISNFAKDKLYSEHNMSYWFNQKYLGLGPSAHSYDIDSRQWNVSSLKKYMDGVNSGKAVYTTETLSDKNKYNEYIITRLRTMWGIEEVFIRNNFMAEVYKNFKKSVHYYMESGHVIYINGVYILSESGLLISDNIMSKLIMV